MMVKAFRNVALGIGMALPTAGIAQDDVATPNPHQHNEIVDTVYLDPYREPTLGSSYSEFVYALMVMDRICWSEYALNAHDNLNALCRNLETVLYEGFEEGAPEDMTFDPRFLEDLPAQLPATTADMAMDFVAKALPYFNQYAQDARIDCPDSEQISACYQFEIAPGRSVNLIVPIPPA
jgi:hypothetical protein